ncbi:hypothetical protein VTH06DRAFT_778 [Thermothelomyces fergusii]
MIDLSAIKHFPVQTVSLVSVAASYLRWPAIASTGIAAVLTALLYFKQKALIYPSNVPPNARTEVPRPSQYNFRDYEELIIPTSDGEKLSAFYIRGPRGGPNSRLTVLMFHGNAGNIGHRLPIARMLIAAAGCNVFMLEYRGYGISTGQPDEAGLNIDAQTNPTAANLSGLIIENTFLSIRKLIPSILPPAKYLSYLCHQVWPSDSLIPSIKVPTLFLSGLQDEIIPPCHMRRLYDLSRAPIKVWKPLPGGDHNSSVVEEGYFEAIAEFLERIMAEEGKPQKE